jgi:IS4 transposase
MAALELSIDELHVLNTVLKAQVDRERLLHGGFVPPMLQQTADKVMKLRTQEEKALRKALNLNQKRKINEFLSEPPKPCPA